MNTYKKHLNTIEVPALVVVPLIALTGCGAIGDVVNATSDAWSVTYELSTDGASGSLISNVSYLSRESRIDEQVTEKKTEVASGPSSPWSFETLALVGDELLVTGQPSPNDHATCRILLDGEREISASTGEPGEIVTCKAQAPEFSSK